MQTTTVFPDLDCIARWLVRNRVWSVLLVGLCFLAALPGLRSLGFESHYKMFVNQENPYLQELNRIEETYQAREDSMAFIVLAPEGEDLFTPQGLALIRDLTWAGREMTDAFDTESLSNFQRIDVSGDLLSARDLIQPEGIPSATEVEMIRDTALGNDALTGRLISENGTLATVIVTFSIAGSRAKALVTMQEEADAIRVRLNKGFPGHRIYLGGLLMFDFAMIEAAVKDAFLIIPMVGLFIFATLWAVFRSPFCSALTIMTVAVNVIATYAVVGYFGYQINVLTFSGMITIATLSVADSTHLLTSFLARVRQGEEKFEAMTGALRLNLLPMLLTSLTTFIGFLALSLSPSPPVQQLGLFTAIGVSLDFLTTVLLLPASVLVLSDYKGLAVSSARYPRWVARQAVSHPKTKLTIGGIVCATVGLFAFKNDLNDNSLKWFDPKIEFRKSIDVSESHLQGFKTITFNLVADAENGTLEPKFMTQVQEFSEWLNGQPEILHVRSYLDVLKDVRRSANENRLEFFALPESREEAAQLLLMHELSVASSRSLNSMLSIDKQETRLLLSLRNLDNKSYLAFEERARAWIRGRNSDITRIGTSVPLMFAKISQDNLHAMIGASVFVMIAISTCIALAFRSIRLGLLALIPNSLPLFLVYGAWGILYGTLDMAAVTTFAVALGIIVDDTIHILSKYETGRQEGLSPEEAVTFSLQTSAVALTVTTFVLGCCFLLQSFSHFQLSASQGYMVALTIMFALVLDLYYFPAVLLTSDRNRLRLRCSSPKGIAALAGVGLVSLFVGAENALADEESKARGAAIVEAADQRHGGYGTIGADGTMTLFDAGGRQTIRRFAAVSREGTRGANTSRMEFKHPKDVEGTVLLTEGRAQGDDRQWIYLPSLGKTRRISGGSSRNSFLGSEFSYEDLTSASIDKYNYEHIGTKACPSGGGICDLVERTPKSRKRSAYTRSVLWISRNRLLTHRIDHYAPNGQNIKIFLVTRFILVDEKHWRIALSRMANNISGRRTHMDWSNYSSGIVLSSATFDPRRLGQ